MADGEIRIKLNADGAGIIATLRKIGLLEGEVGKGGKAAGAAMEEAWKGVITEGVLAARQTERLRAELDRLRERAHGGFLGGGWAGLVTGLNQARELIGSIVSGAVQIGSALYEHAVKPAMELEDALHRVAALSGGGAEGRAAAGRMDAVANAWQDFSTQGNNEFSARVEQALRAGLDMERAMRAVQSTFIAAQGHQETADAMLQKILEVEANGAVTERAIKTFERQGLDLRGALAEQFGAARDEVSGLLQEGAVGVDDLLGALQRLTSEGSRAWSSFQESLDTTSAEVRRAQNDWSDALKGLGTELLPAVAEAMREVSAAVRSIGPELRNVGEVLTSGMLAALREAVSFVSDLVDAVRYMVDVVNDGFTAAELKQKMRWDERERGRLEAASRRFEEEHGAAAASPRVADPEDDAARAARQARERAEREGAREQEEVAKNAREAAEEADKARYAWLMHYGRVSDLDKYAADVARRRGEVAAALGRHVSGGKDRFDNEGYAMQRELAGLDERAAALEGRRMKILAERMAAVMRQQVQRALPPEIVGTSSRTVHSSLSQIGGGGNAFTSLQSVQLQQQKQQTASLKELETVSKAILKVIPRELAGAVLY